MGFTEFKNSIAEKTKFLANKAKDFWKKSLVFAGDNLSKTTLFIESEEQYKSTIDGNKSVILAFDESSELYSDIILMLPVWQTKSFLDVFTFRYLNQEKSGDIIVGHAYTPVEMRLFMHGQEVARFSTFDEIKQWWSGDRKFLTEEQKESVVSDSTEATPPTESEKTETPPVDPLKTL